MNYTIKDFFEVLFEDGEKVNIRIIKDDNTDARGSLSRMPNIRIFTEYTDAFPCAGINPRVSQMKLSAIKNMVIDLDGQTLPEWAHDHADMICSRDETHHHLYFCFLPTDRETYKKVIADFIKGSTRADKAVSDPERVMRLPYFAHRKNGIEHEGYKIVFIRENIERVDIAEKFVWIATICAAQEATQMPTNTIAYLRDLYKRKPVLNKGDGRSRELFFIGLDCHTWGVPQDQAVTLATEISDARYNPPENSQVIQKQINSAYQYAKGEFGAALLPGETAAVQKKGKKFFELVQKVRDKLSTWVYIHAACRFVDTATGKSLTSRDQIEDYISQTVGETVTLRKLLSAAALETCDNIEYAPENSDKTYEVDGIKYYNSYRCNKKEMARDEKHEKTAPRVFMDHINFIGTSPVERVALLNYFAYCVQNIGKKVDWTPLIISTREGLGKSAFAVLFRKIYGDHNCSTVSAHKLLSGWTDFVAEKLFVTSHEVETSESSALTELKTLITENRVVVNAKYARTYETNNCANFLLLSNKLSALRLEKNSRRFLVIVNKCEPKSKDYYKKLFEAIENGVGWIYDALMEIDLSAFDPHGAAPETEGLKMLADATTPDAVAWLNERREQREGAFMYNLVNISAIETDAASFAQPNVTRYLSRKVITSYLHNVGYTQREHYIGGVHHRCWFYGNDEEYLKELDILRGETKREELPF